MPQAGIQGARSTNCRLATSRKPGSSSSEITNAAVESARPSVFCSDSAGRGVSATRIAPASGSAMSRLIR